MLAPSSDDDEKTNTGQQGGHGHGYRLWERASHHFRSCQCPTRPRTTVAPADPVKYAVDSVSIPSSAIVVKLDLQESDPMSSTPSLAKVSASITNLEIGYYSACPFPSTPMPIFKGYGTIKQQASGEPRLYTCWVRRKSCTHFPALHTTPSNNN